VRTPATVGFVLLGPGIAVVRLLRLESRLAEFTLGVALGVALGGLVTGVLLYLGMWNPARAMIILAAFALVALALDPMLIPRIAWVQAWGAVRGRARLLAGLPEPATGGSAVMTPSAASKPSASAGSSESAGTLARPAAPPGPRAPASPDTATHPAPPSSPDHARESLPPPPIAVVRRGPRKAPVAIRPTRSGGRREAFGEDPLNDADISKRMRTTIDDIIDDLAGRKDEQP
jgi:hypothetical protein